MIGSLEGRTQRDPTGGDPASVAGVPAHTERRPEPAAVECPGMEPSPPYMPENPFASFPRAWSGCPRPLRAPGPTLSPEAPAAPSPSQTHRPVPRSGERSPPTFPAALTAAAAAPFCFAGEGGTRLPPSPRTPPPPPLPRPARRRGEGGSHRSPGLWGPLLYHRRYCSLLLSPPQAYYFYFIFFYFHHFGGPMMRAHPHSAAHGDLVPKHLSHGAPPPCPARAAVSPRCQPRAWVMPAQNGSSQVQGCTPAPFGLF